MDKSKSIWLRRKPGKHAVLPDEGSTGICLQQKHGELSVSNTHSHGNQNISGWGRCRIVQVALRLYYFSYTLTWCFGSGSLEVLDLLKAGAPDILWGGEGSRMWWGRGRSYTTTWSQLESGLSLISQGALEGEEKNTKLRQGGWSFVPTLSISYWQFSHAFWGENRHILWRRMNSWIPSSQYSQELGAGRWGDLMVKVIPQQLLHLDKHGWLHRASVFTFVKRNK